MPVAPYPRPGEPLAPALLEPLLHVPVPRQPESDGLPVVGRCLSDLNATVWEQFPHEACVDLGQAVVRRVLQSSYTLIRDHAHLTLPKPSRAFAVADLPLEGRTINALGAHVGPLPLEPDRWARVTIQTLMGIPGFGAKSLVDFLCSYQAFCSRDLGAFDGPIPASPPSAGGCEHLLGWAADPSRRASRHLLNLRLPAPPADWEARSTRLQNRTANALRRNGLDRNPESQAGLTLGRLLALPGFGEQSAKELVAALLQESARPVLPPSQTLEDELRQMIACSLPRVDRRTIAIALRYLGLDGMGGGTLQEVGDAFGISRERVRQIVERAGRAVGHCNWDAPLLSRVVKAAAKTLPRRARDVEFDLRQQGLIAAPISLDRVALVADLVGQERVWGLKDVAGEAVVVPAYEGDQARRPVVGWRRSSPGTDISLNRT